MFDGCGVYDCSEGLEVIVISLIDEGDLILYVLFVLKVWDIFYGLFDFFISYIYVDVEDIGYGIFLIVIFNYFDFVVYDC